MEKIASKAERDSIRFMQIKFLKNKTGNTFDGIKRKNFPPKKGNHCNWCDYKDLSCPIWED